MRISPLIHSWQYTFCTCLLLAMLGGCGGARQPENPAQSVFALEGPPLSIVAEYQGIPLEGSMDRHVMVGIGSFELHSIKENAPFNCKGTFNNEPSGKARIRGVLECSDKKLLFVTLSNLGPDQGVGVGKAENNEDLLTLFYHASKEEAKRRFPNVRDALLQAGKKVTE